MFLFASFREGMPPAGCPALLVLSWAANARRACPDAVISELKGRERNGVAPISGWSDPIVLASLTGGSVSLVGFMCVEHWSRAPMLPRALFRSRTFSAVNLLTLLLYAALGGVLFVLPFALIQVHGYPATLAGAAFLPFTILMAGLSRWAGGLLDRYGARLPLVIGPAIAALGIGVMAVTVTNGSY